ncbi:cAMP-specific cyclic phosphodiesterase, partial [Acrasis kona]
MVWSSRALNYNDQSILENHHCAQGFTIMSDPECDILKYLSMEDKTHFRDIVIRMVLSTDISRHAEIITKLKSGILQEFKVDSSEDIVHMLKMFVKCADIGNPAKKLPLSKLWAERVMQEFYLQGDREKKLSLPVSNFMDRDKPNTAKAQDGFITYIAKPLFECLAQFEPNLQSTLDNVNNNRSYWREEMTR